MVDINNIFGETLKAADLKGTEPVVTISRVEVKEFDGKRKLAVSFVGKKKILVCNTTNARRIAMGHGSETEHWIGKKIQLYTDIVDFQGRPTEAVRVRPVKPAPPPPSADDMNDSVADVGDTF
jgi:hypothetical protein